MFDKQLFFLSLSILVPLYLMVRRQWIWLVAWISFVSSIGVFDTNVGVNLTAGRVAGLLLLPHTLLNLPFTLKSRPAKAVLINFAYMILIGIFFYTVFPWEEGAFDRTYTQLPQMRAIIYLLRTVAEISVSFFVAQQFIEWKWKCFDVMLKFFLIGAMISALAGIFEFMTRIDLYSITTGKEVVTDGYRVRGLYGESRYLGLITTYGIIMTTLLMLDQRYSTSRFLFVSVYLIAFFFAGSTSALVALSFGLLMICYCHKNLLEKTIPVMTIGVLIIAVTSILLPDYSEYFQGAIDRRIVSRPWDHWSNTFEYMANRMGLFDGAAFRFLLENPGYFLSGTGPGLISVPASDYVDWNDPSVRWAQATGINSLPLMGGLLEVSNTGIIGLILWFVVCHSSFHSLSQLARYQPDEKKGWMMIRNSFAAVAAVYFVQNSGSTIIWPIFVGIGIGANYIARFNKPKLVESTWPPAMHVSCKPRCV